MTTHHTTILHTDEPVSIVVGERSDRWHRVLNALYAEGIMAGLKDREYRVLHVMMLLRQDDGHAYAPVPSIQTLTGYASARNVEYALSALLGHPRGLLAAAGRDRYLVLPGWSFAGRDERTHVRDGTHERSRFTHDRSEDRSAYREAHAPDLRIQAENKTSERAPNRAGQARAGIHEPGWPDWDSLIYAQRAIRNGDPSGLLAAIGLTDPLLSATAALDGLTVEEVIREAEQVGRDALASLGTSKPIRKRRSVLAARLFEERGLPVPEFRPKPKGRPAPSGLSDDELKARRIAELRAWERNKEAARV